MKTQSYKLWLNKRRNELGLSQYDLARKLGLNYQIWRQHCSQNRFPELVREDMCRILETSAKELDDLGFNFAKIERRKLMAKPIHTPKLELYSYNIIHLIKSIASLDLSLCTVSQVLRLVEIEIHSGVKFGPEAVREIISSLQKPE